MPPPKKTKQTKVVVSTTVDVSKPSELDQVRFGLLGEDLYYQCQQGEAVSEDMIKQRIAVLKKAKANQDDFDEESLDVFDYFIPFKANPKATPKTVTKQEVQQFQEMCKLHAGTKEQAATQLAYRNILKQDWTKNSERVIVDDLIAIDIHAGATLFHGTRRERPFPKTFYLPAYFGTLQTATGYAFRLKENMGEQGKIIMLRVKEPIRILNLGMRYNFEVLFPPKIFRALPKDIQTALEYGFMYNPTKKLLLPDIVRTSNFEMDKVLIGYLCEVANQHGLDGVGYTRIPEFHDEVILCNQTALKKLEQYPYDIIGFDNLSDTDGGCLYIVESYTPDKDVKVIGAVARNYFSYESKGEQLHPPVSEVAEEQLQQMCALQTLSQQTPEGLKFVRHSFSLPPSKMRDDLYSRPFPEGSWSQKKKL